MGTSGTSGSSTGGSLEPLEVVIGAPPHQDTRTFATGPVRFGRHADNDVVIQDQGVSRHHAVADREHGVWVLRDLHSMNGLLVGDRQVEQLELTGTHRVSLGDVPITLRVLTSPLQHDSSADPVQRAAALPVGDPDALLTPSLAPADAMRIVHRAASALVAHPDLDALLATLLDLICEQVPVDRAQVLLLDAETGRLEPHARRILRSTQRAGLQISRRIADEAIRSREAVLVVDTGKDQRFDPSQSMLVLGIRSAMCVPMCNRDRVVGLLFVDRSAANAFDASQLELLSILASLSAAAVERAQLQERVRLEQVIRARLSRYHAPAVVDHIVASGGGGLAAMTAEEREVTVLFADIAGFTQLAEQLPPRAVTDLLNELFEALTAEVFREAGTLDKFLGDAVMAFFGAPLKQPDHAARAVRTALRMQRRLAERNARHPAEPPLSMRIGIESGNVVVGDVGARRRRDYTVIGDAVNTASRLESSVAAPGQVVVGERCHAALADAFASRPLAPVVLRGKTLAVQPFLIESPGAATEA